MTTLTDWTGKPLDRRPDRIAVAASAVIFDPAGRVLLMLRADNGWWGIPGGRAEIGESISQTAVREVFEETGLRVSLKRLVGVYSDPAIHTVASYPDGSVVQYVSLCFEAAVEGGELRGSPEGEELRFFEPDHLPANTLLAHCVRIQDALAGQIAAFVR